MPQLQAIQLDGAHRLGAGRLSMVLCSFFPAEGLVSSNNAGQESYMRKTSMRAVRTCFFLSESLTLDGFDRADKALVSLQGTHPEADEKIYGYDDLYGRHGTSGQISEDLLIIHGLWKSAARWTLSRKNKSSQRLKSQLSDDEIRCYFDVCDKVQTAERAGALEMFSFLQLLSYSLPCLASEEVYSLILEATGRNPDEYRRIGVATANISPQSPMMQDWEEKTIKIV